MMKPRSIKPTVTRAYVAKAIGRSLATVRRLEGSLLHPTQDRLGVWRFKLAEVRELADTIRRGRSISRHLQPMLAAPPLWREEPRAELEQEIRSVLDDIKRRRPRLAELIRASLKARAPAKKRKGSSRS